MRFDRVDGHEPYVGLGWGRRVWERRLFLAEDSPVYWAARILRELAVIDPGLPEVDAVIACATNPVTWRMGRIRSYAAKARYLNERAKVGGDTPRVMLVWFLELVAKVAYDASDPRDPFDDDAGSRIAPAAVRIAANSGDEELAVRVAAAIDGWLVDLRRVR